MDDSRIKKRREFLARRLQHVFSKKYIDLKNKEDFTFHMLDWLEDFYKLYDLYENIDKKDDKEVRKVVMDFLVHAPNHLNAAVYLFGLGKVEDTFDLGITKGEKAKR